MQHNACLCFFIHFIFLPSSHHSFISFYTAQSASSCFCSNSLSLSPLQGLMFGYATDETEECMPLTIVLAHRLNAKMAELRRNGIIPWLRPDSKTQVRLCITIHASFFLLSPQLPFCEFAFCF